MSTEINCIVHQDTNVNQLSSLLKEHLIVYDPPYDLNSLISPFIARQGRHLKIILHHSSRNVSIIDADIRHHVLQTAVAAFQAHRMQPMQQPRRPMHQPRRPMQQPRRPMQQPRRPMQQPRRPMQQPRQSRRPMVCNPSFVPQDTGKQCSICFETILSDQLYCLPCAHVFHESCVRRWFEQSVSCPVCRFELA
jgi:hypothetical protein